jgi:hypothetical protein
MFSIFLIFYLYNRVRPGLYELYSMYCLPPSCVAPRSPPAPCPSPAPLPSSPLGNGKEKRRHLKASLNCTIYLVLYYKITDYVCKILSLPFYVHRVNDKDPVFTDRTLVPILLYTLHLGFQTEFFSERLTQSESETNFVTSLNKLIISMNYVFCEGVTFAKRSDAELCSSV